MHPLVLRFVGFRHAHGAGLEGPLVIKTVLQIGVEGGDIDVRMVPLRTGVGLARQVDRFAVGVARETADVRARFAVGLADRKTQGGVFTQIEVQRAVQRGGLVPFGIDERVAVVLVGNEAPAHGAGLVQRPAGVQLQTVVVP
ncbi:hypothetical protein D3C84_488290 [compost metagenome]